eukprot:73947-Karenia_brevis.AAC.1
MKHLPGTKQTKGEQWAKVSADVDIIRAAQTQLDFRARLAAIRQKWIAEGLDAASRWVDKSGVQHDFVAHFTKQWAHDIPE